MGNVIWTPNNKDAVDGAKLHRSNSLLASANVAAAAVASDAAEATSTADKIVATAHAARVGDIIRFTSGVHDDIEVRVLKVTDVDTFFIEALASAVGVGDTFDILRPQTLSVDGTGNLNVSLASSAGSYAEDSAHVSGDEGIAMLAVRNDTAAVMTSTDGDYSNLTVDSTGRLRVDATITEAATAADGGALPAVVKVAGGYDGANVQVLHTDVAGDLQVDLASAIPAGTNNIGDVDVLTLPGGLTGYAEDAAHGSGDIGLMPLAVRSDAGGALAGTDGDYSPLQVDATGNLRVSVSSVTEQAVAADGAVGLPAVVKVVGGYDGANVQAIHTDAAGDIQVDLASAIPAGTNNIGDVDVLTLPGGLTGYAEDAAHGSGDVGVMPLAVRSDAGGALAGTDGDYSPLQVDATGNLRVSVSSITEQAVVADGGALPAVVKVIGGYDGANVQAIATDASGNIQADILALPGGLTAYAEDAAHTTGDFGVMALAVRNDSLTALAGTTGDYAPIQVDSVGRVKVAGAVTAGGKSVVTTVRNDYASVNVTAGAWVQLVAALGADVTELEIFDSSGETLELGTGAAAAEARLILVVPGGNGRVPVSIASGTRLSIRAVSATASVGELDINTYGV